MIKEAIDRIAELVRQDQQLPLTEVSTEIFDDNPQSYLRKIEAGPNGRQLGAVLTPFRPPVLAVTTLTGLVDAIHAGAAGDMSRRIVHVEDYLHVAVKSAYSDAYGVRDTVVKAEHKPATPFVFDTFYTDPSKFIIALNASFLVTEELVQLQRLASAMTAKSEIGTQDDGFSQTVTVKRGEVTTAEVKLKPRCKLVPMRTFDEAAPVESEFLVRLKQTEQGVPAIALFSVDGTKWQGQCMQSIKNWLQQALGSGVPVLA